ncbi:Na+/H+ antiporter subunit C [Nakamurella sp. YIM 132087]|uniref:Na+/H+ antiporter subunit C n=1 Tax=Nakamurella alba TaxID=2665158 RepID=A0A7K1FGS3_9ACTN|nr:NADH-quinone oxidoreductase subunit K [Nakamurella alba]MTD13266.1 Na+/H+ antiporter subunit C [Nakamurella alba]
MNPNALDSNVTIAVIIGVSFACGVYLLMSKNLIRVLLGFLLVGHGTNLLLLSSGRGGIAPIAGSDGDLADPLPQALILTSIVITLAVVTFLLAMAYRNYRLTRETEVADDPDDAAVAHRGETVGGGE